MGTFTNVSSTAVDLDADIGFSMADFAAAFADIDEEVLGYLSQTEFLEPWTVELNNSDPLDATEAYVEFPNGIEITATGSANSSGVASITELFANYPLSSGGDLNAWFVGSAKANITPSSIDSPEFDVTSVGTLTEIGFAKFGASSFEVADIAKGTLNFNLSNYSYSGSLTSYTMAMANTLTLDAYDALYITLTGSIKGFGTDSISGTITGYSYGTIANVMADDLAFTPVQTITGIKLNALTTIMAMEESGSFDALGSGLYSGNDSITGTDGADTLDAGAGNDKLYGLAGNDTLSGGEGNDLIEGGAGADNIGGGAGNDTIYGYTQVSVENAEDGNDSMNGRGGNDTIYGGTGNDSMNGSAGNDKLYGGTGDDTMGGDLRPDSLPSGVTLESDEFLKYGNDQLDGGDGNDSMNGGAGNDKLLGGAGNDTIGGDFDPGTYTESRPAGNDTIDGGDGDDSINGGGGNDKIVGGAGNDTIGGDFDADTTHGNDKIDGGAGYDMLFGKGGNDKLIGGTENDLLAGGAGNDMLTGGTGNDYFVFNFGDFTKVGLDKITDFKSGEDKLWFDLDIYTALDGMTAENLTTDKVAGTGDFLVYTGGKLYYDADADGSGASVLIAQVKGLLFGDLAFGNDYTEIVLMPG